MANNKTALHQESGFALLITIVLVGVIISIGISVLDLSIKQIRLSTNAKDSELAFSAANAGMECALYHRRNSSAAMESGADITPSCFGETVSNYSSPTITITNAEAYLYSYEFTWGETGNRCTQLESIVISANSGSDVDLNTASNRAAILAAIPGFPNSAKTCIAGTVCTILSSQGFNRPCSTIGSVGTVQREVLLQL